MMIRRVVIVTFSIAMLVLFVGSTPDTRPCHRTVFKTKAIKVQCEKGGQLAAKRYMAKFVRGVRRNARKDSASPQINLEIKCNTCHLKMGGGYPLRESGLQKYFDFGGK